MTGVGAGMMRQPSIIRLVRTFQCALAALLTTPLFVIAASGDACAAPWTREPRRLFIETRTDYFRLAEERNVDGIGTDGFERVENTTYLEYGVFEGFMIGAKASYGASWIDGVDGEQSISGLSEFEAFAQHTLFNRRWGVLSVRTAVSRPALLAAGARPELAADSVDSEVSALYGKTLTNGPIKVFATAEAGYRRRFGAAADQARGAAAIGIEPSARWLLLLEGSGSLSLQNASPGGADFDVLRFQPSLVWRPPGRISVRGGAMIETASRNLPRGQSYFLALWATF